MLVRPSRDQTPRCFDNLAYKTHMQISRTPFLEEHNVTYILGLLQTGKVI